MNDVKIGNDKDPLIPILWEDLANLNHPGDILVLLQECVDQSRDWGSSACDGAKNALKSILLDSQRAQCAYCRRRIKAEVGHVEIDHILPKSAKGDIARGASNSESDRHCTPGYPQFTFEVRNLILTCKRCNNKKGSYDSRRDRSIPALPAYELDSNCYIWVHPYIDRYSDHILLHKGLIYIPRNISDKGDALIRTCKLDSIAAVEVLARDLVTRSSRDYIDAIMKLLGEVDKIGWEVLTDAVIDAFPKIDSNIIEKRVEQIRRACEE